MDKMLAPPSPYFNAHLFRLIPLESSIISDNQCHDVDLEPIRAPNVGDIESAHALRYVSNPTARARIYFRTECGREGPPGSLYST